MNKLVLKLLLLGSTFFFWGLTSSMALAKPIIYDFTVEVTEGSLQGNSFKGFFGYDDSVSGGVGVETIDIEKGLTVCMTFFDQTYTAKDDSHYPNFPQLQLNNGTVEKLDFWIEEGKRLNWWNLPGWEVTMIARPDLNEFPPCLSSTQ